MLEIPRNQFINSQIPVTGQSVKFLDSTFKNLPHGCNCVIPETRPTALSFCPIWDHPQSYIAQKLTEESPEGDLEKQKKGKVIKFGWIEGVYVSILNYLLKSVKTLLSFSR